MPDINVGGLRYYVEDTGTGIPLVLLHGFTGSTQSWQHLIPELSKSCRVIAIDLPGHGRTDTPAEPQRFAFMRVIDDLAAVARELAIEGAILAGYSMGGRVALAMAHEHPSLVAGMILESASPGLAAPSARAERRRHDAELADSILRDGIPDFVAKWEKLPLWASQALLPQEVLARQRAIRLANSPHGLAESLRGMGTGSQPSYWEQLPQVCDPTLLLAGALDVKFAHIATGMHAALPNAVLEIFPDAGHAVHLECPQHYLKLVSQFLNDVQRNEFHELKEEGA